MLWEIKGKSLKDLKLNKTCKIKSQNVKVFVDIHI